VETKYVRMNGLFIQKDIVKVLQIHSLTTVTWAMQLACRMTNSLTYLYLFVAAHTNDVLKKAIKEMDGQFPQRLYIQGGAK